MKSSPDFGVCLKLTDIGAMYNVMPNDTPPSMATAAREFIERHGEAAPEIARQRARVLSLDGSSPEHDTALLLLSAVERLSNRIANDEVD